MKMLVLALLAIAAMPATAQEMSMAAPVCPKDAEPIPAELTGWSSKTPLAAATDEASLRQASVTPGTAVDVALGSTPSVKYVVRPSRPGGSVSYGGMLGLVIATPGTYLPAGWPATPAIK